MMRAYSCSKATFFASLAAIWLTAAAPRCAWGQNTFPSTGNVGIGTANPIARFTISSDAQGTLNSGVYLQDTGGRSFSIASRYNFLGFADESSAVYRIVIDQSGNVGIGTTNPQHLLQVAGAIGAQEVLVTSTGADYVFEPGYRLKPLREVASYIEANHHLPDIPSADEVKQKGLGVGEMEAKLLAKVEELTLHMIAADQRSERLEKENRDLRKRVMRLEPNARHGK